MLNQFINVFWTIVSFTIVGQYWGGYYAEKGSLWTLYIIIVISISVYTISAKWLLVLTLSNNPRTYERIGVKWVLLFVQNGTLVNRMKRMFGSKPGTITTRKGARAYLKTVDMQERFHYCCLVLFGLSAVSALFTGKNGLAIFITFWNIIYNVYPILLQQYNRLRIQRIMSRV
jgi:hypothetical protein